MTPEQVLGALGLVAAGALLGTWASGFRRALSVAPSIPDQPPTPNPQPACSRHIWLVAATEQTAGHERRVYRCSDCGALEVRETP